MGSASSTLKNFVEDIILAIRNPNNPKPKPKDKILQSFITELEKISAFGNITGVSYAFKQSGDGFCVVVVTKDDTVLLEGNVKNKKTWKVRNDLIVSILVTETKKPFGECAVFFPKRDFLKLCLAGVTTAMPPDYTLEHACARHIQNNFFPTMITGKFDDLDVIDNYSLTSKEMTDDLKKRIDAYETACIFQTYYARSGRSMIIGKETISIKNIARDMIEEICGKNTNIQVVVTTDVSNSQKKLPKPSDATLKALKIQEEKTATQNAIHSALQAKTKSKGHKDSVKNILDNIKSTNPKNYFSSSSKHGATSSISADSASCDASCDAAADFNNAYEEIQHGKGPKGKGAKGKGKGAKGHKGGKGSKGVKGGKSQFVVAPTFD